MTAPIMGGGITVAGAPARQLIRGSTRLLDYRMNATDDIPAGVTSLIPSGNAFWTGPKGTVLNITTASGVGTQACAMGEDTDGLYSWLVPGASANPSVSIMIDPKFCQRFPLAPTVTYEPDESQAYRLSRYVVRWAAGAYTDLVNGWDCIVEMIGGRAAVGGEYSAANIQAVGRYVGFLRNPVTGNVTWSTCDGTTRIDHAMPAGYSPLQWAELETRIVCATRTVPAIFQGWVNNVLIASATAGDIGVPSQASYNTGAGRLAWHPVVRRRSNGPQLAFRDIRWYLGEVGAGTE